MIILIKESGNHSNRLLQNIHLEAYCLNHKISFFNPTLCNIEKYYNYQPHLINKCLHFFIKLTKKLGIKIPTVFFTSNYKDIIDFKILNKPIIFVEGWFFREHGLVKKYQDCFSKKYSLKEKYFMNNLLYQKINSTNKKDFLLVGVHIRRGDYINFKNGIYYYEDEIYLSYINIIRDLIQVKFNKDIKIIIFSNDETSFKNSETIMVSRNEWFVDHHLMSLMDYLIGPPSSFTMWASYIGKVPYYHLKTKNDNLKLEEFILSDL